MSERLQVVIEKLVHGGDGLARLPNGHAVFVPGTLPGEQVEIAVRRKRKGFLEASLIGILSPSPARIAPPCSGEIQCTGATWPYIDYPAQVQYKQAILLDSLARIGGMTPERTLPILPSPRVDHYRLRTQFTVRAEDGRQRIGFFRPGTYTLIEVDDAFLLSPILNDTLRAVRKAVNLLPPLSELHMNASPDGQVHLLLWSDEAQLSDQTPLWNRLRQDAPQIIGMTVFTQKQRRQSFGRNQLVLSLDGLAIHVTEGNFYQINWDQNKNMLQTVLDFASLSGDETVLDLYCGVGNFSLPIAKRAKHVVGIEAGYSAIEDARANAARNALTNAEFIADDLQKGLKTLMNRKMRADVVVLDPPRSGATVTTLERILAFVPKKIVYVSCNPATLSRDLKFLNLFGYRLDRLQPIDMFPWTYHIECVAELLRTELD